MIKKEFFIEHVNKAREYSFNFEVLSHIGNFFFNTKPPINNGYCNLGSGPRYLKGYVNADFYVFNTLRKLLGFNTVPNVDWQIDLRKKLNCKNSFFDGIFVEHVLEHLNIIDVFKLLKEIKRVMKPNSILRISVPDLQIYAQYYLSGKKSSNKFSMWDQNRGEAIWSLSHNFGHNCIYDFKFLKKILLLSGFKNIQKKDFNQSSDKMLLIDDPGRSWESLYVEAIPDK
jgi:hypothetical protein